MLRSKVKSWIVRKCAYCNGKLPVLRSRFCGDECAKRFRLAWQKRVRDKKRIIKKTCINCGDGFKPRVAHQKFCTKDCFWEMNKKRRVLRRSLNTKPEVPRKHRFIYYSDPVNGLIPEHVTEASFTKATTPERKAIQVAVEKYLADGGVISRYKSQPVIKDVEEMSWGISETDEKEIVSSMPYIGDKYV